MIRGLRRAALAATLLAFAAGLGPASAASQPPALRVSANTRLGADADRVRGRDAPGLAVDPADPRHIVEVDVEVLKGDCDYRVTFDGGASWKSGHLPAPAGFPAHPCNSGAGSSNMDAGVAFGFGSNVYASFSARRGGDGASALVARSTDGGSTFAPAVVAIAGGASGGTSYNLAKVVARPRATGDRVHVVASASSAVAVATSNDAGANWTAPVNANAAAAREPSQPALLDDGTLLVAWRTSDPVVLSNYVVVGKSTDGGLNWTRTNAATVAGYQGNSSSTFPRLTTDPARNRVYVVYGQGPPAGPPAIPPHAAAVPQSGKVGPSDHFIDPDSDVMLVRSTDAGGIGVQTWSAPVRVNDDPIRDAIAQRHPGVSVSPNGPHRCCLARPSPRLPRPVQRPFRQRRATARRHVLRVLVGRRAQLLPEPPHHRPDHQQRHRPGLPLLRLLDLWPGLHSPW